MSTLTSLVKSGKRNIIKTKTEEPVEHQQKLPKSAGYRASRGFLSRPDPSASRGFLGRPDPAVSQDATRPQ